MSSSIEYLIPVYRIKWEDLKKFLEWRYPGYSFAMSLVSDIIAIRPLSKLGRCFCMD